MIKVNQITPEATLSNRDESHAENDSFEICYAAKPNSLIIRPDGRIAKCTVAFNHEANHVGNITTDGQILINQHKINFWTRGFAGGDVQYLTCPALKLKEYTNE